MKLSELLQNENLDDVAELVISGLSQDSRCIAPGDLYLLRQGSQTESVSFVEQAITNGAVALVYDAQMQLPQFSIPSYPVVNCAERLGELASRFYHYPSRQVSLIGVTGTNGKTSICHYAAQLLAAQSHPVGILGTLGTGLFPDLAASRLTSVEPITLQQKMSECIEQCAEVVLMEVSSHALAQHRIAGCDFDTVVFSNLSRDHLDYHHDMQDYFNTKSQLFTDFVSQNAVINLLDPYGEKLWQRLSPAQQKRAWVLCDDHQPYQLAAAWFSIESIQAIPDGTDIHIKSSCGEWRCSLPLYGHFNVVNTLLAVMSVATLGYPLAALFKLSEQLTAPPGRLQVRRHPRGALIAVDFSHTPDGLTAVLQALKPYVSGHLCCVFGCGGERDRGKRPLMAQAVEQFADRIIVTQDNTRQESLKQITDDIMSGFSDLSRVVCESDRLKAIELGLANLQSGDCLLIAGKGHETTQQLGDVRHPFSDIAVVEDYLCYSG